MIVNDNNNDYMFFLYILPIYIDFLKKIVIIIVLRGCKSVLGKLHKRIMTQRLTVEGTSNKS